jgi:hypothetical protein
MRDCREHVSPASKQRTSGTDGKEGNAVPFLPTGISPASPLKSYWGIVPFVVYKLFGHSLLARPLSRRFWTVSEWNNEVSLRAFVQHPPHVRIMTALGPHMDKTKFVQWTVKGSQLPLKWDDALPQLAD